MVYLKHRLCSLPLAPVLIHLHRPCNACRTIQLEEWHLITIKTQDSRPKSIIYPHQGLLSDDRRLSVLNIFWKVTHGLPELLVVNEISLVCASPKNGAQQNEWHWLACFYCFSYNRFWLNTGHLLALSSWLHSFLKGATEGDEINQK